MDTQKLIDEVRTNDSASFWLRDALETALNRDCVDAANDAELLYHILNNRCKEILTRDWADLQV